MAGSKRNFSDSGASARATKVSKLNASQSPSSKATKKGPKKGAKKGVKPVISYETFKSTALPVHVNLTHTPPTIVDPESEAVSVATADPGFIGNLTLVPSTFSTGSLGWKGSKKITVELQNSEGNEKEKVQVMLTVNATVIGGKPPKADDDDDDDDDAADASVEEE